MKNLKLLLLAFACSYLTGCLVKEDGTLNKRGKIEFYICNVESQDLYIDGTFAGTLIIDDEVENALLHPREHSGSVTKRVKPGNGTHTARVCNVGNKGTWNKTQTFEVEVGDKRYQNFQMD
jgi:hypothetical protein